VSKTVPFDVRGQFFWVYDVWVSFLFAEMAEIAARVPEPGRTPWLAELERQLRVHAIAGASVAVPLGQWCTGHEDEFTAVAAEAARRLARRGSITAREAAGWAVLDGSPVLWRGEDPVATAPLPALVTTMTEIMHGAYPQPPDGLHWYLHPGGTHAI
jgi:hypothetical protein